MHEALMDEDLKSFRDTVRKWIDKEINPYQDKWEEDGIVPKTIYPKAGGTRTIMHYCT